MYLIFYGLFYHVSVLYYVVQNGRMTDDKQIWKGYGRKQSRTNQDTIVAFA
jgi:hypothetical protein